MCCSLKAHDLEAFSPSPTPLPAPLVCGQRSPSLGSEAGALYPAQQPWAAAPHLG